MEDGYYAEKLRQFGVQVEIPVLADRKAIQLIQSKVAKGEDPQRHRATFQQLLSRYDGVDAIVLGCTELPLLIGQDDTAIPLINPIELQCEEAIAFSFAGQILNRRYQ